MYVCVFYSTLVATCTSGSSHSLPGLANNVQGSRGCGCTIEYLTFHCVYPQIISKVGNVMCFYP